MAGLLKEVVGHAPATPYTWWPIVRIDRYCQGLLSFKLAAEG